MVERSHDDEDGDHNKHELTGGLSFMKGLAEIIPSTSTIMNKMLDAEDEIAGINKNKMIAMKIQQECAARVSTTNLLGATMKTILKTQNLIWKY